MQDQEHHHETRRPAMHRPHDPSIGDVGRQGLYAEQSAGHIGHVVEGHRHSSRGLDDKRREHEPAHSVKDVDVGWNVLARNVILDGFYVQPIIKPAVYA